MEWKDLYVWLLNGWGVGACKAVNTTELQTFSFLAFACCLYALLVPIAAVFVPAIYTEEKASNC